ncbi:hypothetical protein EC968_002778 [Mortierella alpina]|nr:hypothetical protein EC968_002778 [Mortierella alpina]
MTRVKSSMFIAATVMLHMAHGVPLVIENNAVCNTIECYALAEGILSDMDIQVDPCIDFSTFACGGYEARAEIPAYRTFVDNFETTENENKLVMRHILELNSSDPDLVSKDDPIAQQNLQKLRDLYTSCMNEDQFKKLGRKPLQAVLQKIIELFPVNGSMLPSPQRPFPSGTNVKVAEETLNKTSLALTLSYFNRLGLATMARIVPTTDREDTSRSMLALVEGGNGLRSPRHYQDEKILYLYKSTIAKMLNLVMGVDPEDESSMALMSNILPEVLLPSHWEDVAQKIVDFEKLLSETFTDISQLMDPAATYNVFAPDRLSRLTPSIDWHLLLDDLLPVDVRRTHPVIVISPSYQERLEVLFQTTEPRTLQAYFVWTAIRQLVHNIASEYEVPLQELDAEVMGTSAKAMPDRWRRCVEVVDWNLGQMAGLKALVTLVGFSRESPDVQSSESLRSYYEDYHVDPDKFFENDIRFRLWRSTVEFRFLERRLDRKTNMPLTPQTVNAFFDPTENRILLPAGMVQPTFFHEKYPEHVNYGGLGSIIGHEFTHAFDATGNHFDESGRKVNWWTNATTEAFAEKAECFVNQYSNFTVTRSDGKVQRVDGKRTLDENIADNGGMRQAFAAWKMRFRSDLFGKRYRNFKLPGLNNFTPEQLFFISFGRAWCKKMGPQTQTSFGKAGSYSPNNWRINGALQNSDEFAWVFGCPVGSPMNPQKKCQLW